MILLQCTQKDSIVETLLALRHHFTSPFFVDYKELQ